MVGMEHTGTTITSTIVTPATTPIGNFWILTSLHPRLPNSININISFKPSFPCRGLFAQAFRASASSLTILIHSRQKVFVDHPSPREGYTYPKELGTDIDGASSTRRHPDTG